VTAALAWGALAASSLLIGAVIGFVRPWPDVLVGVVLAFGAGALISAVSFDLAEEGIEVGGGQWLAFGLAAGALTYFAADRILRRRSGGGGDEQAAGPSLALGALLDGIPEQLVLGIGLSSGGEIGLGLLAAIFVSNLPEAIGSSTELRTAGAGAGAVARIWVPVAVVCTLASGVGWAIADNVSGGFQAAVDGFAAGALLVMLIDAMIPEATRRAGDVAGLATVLGFAVAAGLSLST
jgi:ZIP family zinc transporter